jgi:uncharacterized membrane protein
MAHTPEIATASAPARRPFDARGLAREFGAFLRARFAFTPLDWGVAALVLIGALALDFHQLGGASLWFDETYAIGLASQPIHVMFTYIWSREPNMQFYYLTLHVWLSLTAKLGLNPTETIVRAPSAVFGALGSANLYLLGRRYFGQLAGILGAIIYTASFFALMVAQQTRSYSLQMLFIIIGWYMFFGALSEEDARARRWWWVLYTLATTLGLYSHLYTFFMIVAQVCALGALVVLPGAWHERALRSLIPAAYSLGGGAILILPLIYAAHHGSHTSWVQPATPRDVYNILLDNVSSGDVVYMYLLLGLIVVGLALALVARLLRPRAASSHMARPASEAAGWFEWRLNAPQPGVTLLLCWLVIPFALTYFVTQPYLNLHFFFYRYEVVIMPAFALLAALGVQMIPFKALQAGVVVALLEIAAVSAPYYYTHAQIQDFRDPVTWMQARYQPGDGIICFPNELCSIPVQAYLMAYPGPAQFESYSPGVYSWVKGYAIPPNLARVKNYANIKHRLFFIVATLGGTTSDLATEAAIRQWLAANYTLTGEQLSSSVVVYLYTPKPPAAAPPTTTPSSGKPGASSPTPTPTP